MTLNMSDVDIKNVTIVYKLMGFVLVKADLQGHNSNDRPADALRDKNTHFVFFATIYMAISKKHFVLVLFLSHCVS